MLLVGHVYYNSLCHVRHIETIKKAEVRKIISILEADLKKTLVRLQKESALVFYVALYFRHSEKAGDPTVNSLLPLATSTATLQNTFKKLLEHF